VVGYHRDNAKSFVELTHYLLRGVFLADTWLPYPNARSEIVEAWRGLAPAILRTNSTAERRIRSRSRSFVQV
jgi:hypothetical protein